LLLALKTLKAEKGLTFDISFERRPFFLRQGQESIDSWLKGMGLPPDAPVSEVKRKMGWGGPRMAALFEQAGLDRNMDVADYVQYADTMNSHRLAWYASSVDDAKGELMWCAFSRRYFEGKDTAVRPIRLDSRQMLLECAAEVGLDVQEAERVLDSDLYRKEIEDVVEEMHAAGINSIPVLCFEVDGVAEGSWLQNQRSKGRVVNHGSGSQAEFCNILQQLHTAC